MGSSSSPDPTRRPTTTTAVAVAVAAASHEPATRAPLSPRKSALVEPAEPTRRSSQQRRNSGGSGSGSSSSSSSSWSRPTTSPHATHAMVLQLQEYQHRVESACATTYQFALRPPPGRRRSSDKDSSPRNPSQQQRRAPYARSRILASNREPFPTRDSGPLPPSAAAASSSIEARDRALGKNSGSAHVRFHQMSPRRNEFLYGDNGRQARLLDPAHGSSKGKDHFGLGPGQYDVVRDRPHSTIGAAVKFSPSDRFHENYSTDRPGPGQYLMSEELTSTRAATAVFSQMPRRTDMGSLVSPTANVVSSYYYVPDSDFADKRDHHHGWSRTPRFAKDRRRCSKPPTVVTTADEDPPPPTDFVQRNIHQLREEAAIQRLRRRMHASSDHGASPRECAIGASTSSESRPSLRRRPSLLVFDTPSSGTGGDAAATAGAPSPASMSARIQATSTGASRAVREAALAQGWVTLAMIASFQVRMMRYHQLTSLIRRIRTAQRRKIQQAVFVAWTTLDQSRHRKYAAHLIVKNSFRFRLWLRVRRKRGHLMILRQFLGGLSFDVRFSLAMKRIKRKIIMLQRWWRHVQLMVRAREEALYHKWITVETRLRLEYINQMPHLSRIFQPPAGTVAAAQALSSGIGGLNPASMLHASDLQLHKLLNLPDQRRWFSARFVLTSDGGLRGYALEDNELLVEIKNFRCHYHDVEAAHEGDGRSGGGGGSDGPGATQPSAGFHAYHSYTNAAWKPFLMLFRQGAFRFVMVASPSPMPTEILSWKEKLERLMGNVGLGGSGLGLGGLMPPLYTGGTLSGAMLTSQLSGPSSAASSFYGSVSDLVEVSMQSGILAPASSSHGLLSSGGGQDSSPATALSRAGSSSPMRGKLQSKVRSIRQRNKTGLSVAEGQLSYVVVDLLKDFPKVPSAVIWQTIREKLREKRKAFRGEIYRYKLELFHYQQHQEQVKTMHVLDKFRDFFSLERPRRPHFRSLISNRKMESLIRQTVEQVKQSTPSNPRYLVDSNKL